MHFLVESEAHGLFEIRQQRLPHKGDIYSLGVDPQRVDVSMLRMRYYTRYQLINYYYQEVNKKIYNICPGFYRFKISPLSGKGEASSHKLSRAYEVEEYMGKLFIEDLANMH